MSSQPIPRRAKVGHRKSRNGCLKCKSRRVKCDEGRPVCGNCSRLALDCSWADGGRPLRKTPALSPGAAHASASASRAGASGSATRTTAAHPQGSPVSGDPPIVSTTPSSLSGPSPPSRVPGSSSSSPPGFSFWPASLQPSPAHSHSHPHPQLLALLGGGSGDEDNNHPDVVELPESRERRMLEHRLMQNYLFTMARPFSPGPSQEWLRTFERTIPALALEHDNLLYALLASSATQLLMAGPDDAAALFHARQSYLIAAMREQRRLVDALTMDNADAVCLASLFLLVTAFGALRERSLEPYTPPVEWLRQGRGAGAVIGLCARAAYGSGRYHDSAIFLIATSYPRFGQDESYFDPENRRHLHHLLPSRSRRRRPDDASRETRDDDDDDGGDDWDDEETREAYEKTLSYVGSIQRAIDSQEPAYVVCRRIQAFPMVVPARFVAFVEELRPRALVVLAHFFAAVAQVRGAVWWLGDWADPHDTTAQREIRAVAQVLPPAWQPRMVWPLDMAGVVPR